MDEQVSDAMALSSSQGSEHCSAQQMVTNLRSAGVSQTRIAKHIQCPQANVSRWQAGLCKPNGEYMMRLVALWKEKCGG